MKDIPSLEEENLTRLRQLTLTLNGSELKGGPFTAIISSVKISSFLPTSDT